MGPNGNSWYAKRYKSTNATLPLPCKRKAGQLGSVGLGDKSITSSGKTRPNAAGLTSVATPAATVSLKAVSPGNLYGGNGSNSGTSTADIMASCTRVKRLVEYDLLPKL